MIGPTSTVSPPPGWGSSACDPLRTYVEDVRFIDPDGESVGREALNDRAQKILDDAPADFVLEEDGLAYVSPDTAVQPWRFGPPGSPVVRGIDVLTVRDGSVSVVRTLIGFRKDAWTMRGVGKSACIEFFLDPNEALEAAGLRE